MQAGGAVPPHGGEKGQPDFELEEQRAADVGEIRLGRGELLPGHHLEIDLATNDLHDVAADPDFLAVLAQMDAARALEGRALGRDIGRLGESGADEPLREARVKAAGDRMFVY